MKKSIIGFALVVAVIVTSLLVYAQQPAKQIDDWAAIRKDMEMAKGALKQTIASTILNTYIPDYGVVFLFSVNYGMEVEDVQTELNKALLYLTPTISRLQDHEKIVIAGYYDSFIGSSWELIYVATKNSSADPSTWEIYYNKQ